MRMYKILVEGKSVHSAFKEYDQRYVITYEKGKTHVPLIGKLFGFTDTNSLKDYLSSLFSQAHWYCIRTIKRNNIQIAYGEATNVRESQSICDTTMPFDTWWDEDDKSSEKIMSSSVPPKGTVEADSFEVQEIYSIEEFYRIGSV